MTAFLSYAGACAALVAVSAGALVGLLPPPARKGVWVAGGVAFGVQLAAAAIRARWGRRHERLLLVWVTGAGMRLLAVAATAVAVAARSDLHPVSTLVGLAGYLFAMLLLEPVLMKVGERP